MQANFALLFIVLAIVLFAISAAGVASRINLQSMGLACLALAMFITGWKVT